MPMKHWKRNYIWCYRDWTWKKLTWKTSSKKSNVLAISVWSRLQSLRWCWVNDRVSVMMMNIRCHWRTRRHRKLTMTIETKNRRTSSMNDRNWWQTVRAARMKRWILAERKWRQAICWLVSQMKVHHHWHHLHLRRTNLSCKSWPIKCGKANIRRAVHVCWRSPRPWRARAMFRQWKETFIKCNRMINNRNGTKQRWHFSRWTNHRPHPSQRMSNNKQLYNRCANRWSTVSFASRRLPKLRSIITVHNTRKARISIITIISHPWPNGKLWWIISPLPPIHRWPDLFLSIHQSGLQTQFPAKLVTHIPQSNNSTSNALTWCLWNYVWRCWMRKAKLRNDSKSVCLPADEEDRAKLATVERTVFVDTRRAKLIIFSMREWERGGGDSEVWAATHSVLGDSCTEKKAHWTVCDRKNAGEALHYSSALTRSDLHRPQFRSLANILQRNRNEEKMYILCHRTKNRRKKEKKSRKFSRKYQKNVFRSFCIVFSFILYLLACFFSCSNLLCLICRSCE